MEFFKKTPRIPFMGKRAWCYGFSTFLMVATLVLLVTRGLNFGIDFTGGVVLELAYPDTADLDKARAAVSEALRAAQIGALEGAAAAGQPAPTLLAVTVLTSWAPARFAAELAIEEPLTAYVPRLAQLAAAAGIGGAVCSPLEVAALRAIHPNPYLLITPGIRPAGSERGDQQRVMTPAAAIAAGASRLVIGRPITAAADPVAAFAACCQELG